MPTARRPNNAPRRAASGCHGCCAPQEEEEVRRHRLVSLLILSILPISLFVTWARLLPYPPEEHESFTFTLPSIPSTVVPDTPDTPRILISESGDVSVTGESFDSASDQNLPSLRIFLRERTKSPKGLAGVFVEPEPSVQYQRIIDVLSAIHDEHVPLYTFN